MKRIALALMVFSTPAFAQQQPSPQAQIFALEHQISVLMQDDQAAVAQAYDLNAQLQDAQAQVKALQAQLAAKAAKTKS